MSRNNNPSSLPLRITRAVARVILPTVCVGLGLGQQGVRAAQHPDSIPSWMPGEAMESEVRSQLSERWGVLPEALVLEWGEPRGGDLPYEYDRVRLMGAGRDGRWVASFGMEDDGGDSRSVLLRAGVLVPQKVAGRALERGRVLGEEDIVVEQRIHWGPPRGVSEECVVGWVAQRPVDQGEPLSVPAVRPPLLVVSGRPVIVLWSRGNVDLRVAGTAVGSASLGERVFVRTEAGTRLDGLVEGPGMVRVSGHAKESGR